MTYRKKFPKFNIKKMKGLGRSFNEEYDEILSTKFIQLRNLVAKISNEKDSAIIQALKDYFIIHLVTIIEDSMKLIVKNLIDIDLADIRNLFDNDEIRIRLSQIETIKNEELTIGEIVISNFSLQNPLEIDSVFSNILKINFFETMLEILQEPATSDVESSAELEVERRNLYSIWPTFLEMFQIRNNIVHNISGKNDIDFPKIELLLDGTQNFIQFVFFLSDIVYFHNKVDDIHGIDDRSLFANEYFGLSGEKISNIISKKLKEYLDKTRPVFKYTCADCGDKFELTYKLPEGRPAYCPKCFRKHRRIR